MKLSCTLASALLLLAALSAPVMASGQEATVTPKEALKLLQEGNLRLIDGHALHPHTDRARIADLASHGQHPFATVVACSDSRVPVELIFDEGFGDLFVIRVAGNVCDVDEVASIEYGVDHLGTPLMVVMGHSHCGAVTAVATDEKLEGSIPRLVDNIRPAIQAAKRADPHAHGEALIAASVRANVWQGIEDLLNSSSITRERVTSGKLKIVGAIYHLETGKVEWMGEHPRQGELLKANRGHAANDSSGRSRPRTGQLDMPRAGIVQTAVATAEHRTMLPWPAILGLGLPLAAVAALHSKRPR